ncbi:WS/DGAT/MGAT family O-acyltransferase [Congregibacter sp.]|uniref:WS/DGAT/MGAT family O-acyltransferase n=1 Tax=Congregibacter sp. TaxID=2744308 RepID=UPI00385BED11
MRRIDLASAGFLLLEKRETPMHVGGINLFTLPEGVDEQEFLTSLRTQLRENTEFRKPFGEYVVTGKTGLYWEKDEHIDMDYHVRHSALPSPGRYRELFALASRFHTTLLDRTRPLWELHLIEGLQDRQFAVYNKVHHAAIDGVGAMHITQAMCTESPSGPPGYAPYSLEAYKAYKQSRFGDVAKATKPSKRDMRNVLEALKQQYDSSINLATAMRRFGLAFVGRSGNLAVPWHNVPKTSINTRVSGARRFVAQTFAFDRVKEVCRALDATVNDVVLAMCAGALRRYLLSRDELPLHSLKAMAPVSLREEGDVDSSNAIGFITADMATNIYDPEKRLRTIQESMRAGKDLLRELSPAEGALFMQLTQLPALLTSILGLGSKFPAFSTVVSNVPGPRKPLYWHGARLDGIYPASIVFDGFAMNITLVSYHDQLDFGIVACRRSMPQIQRIIDHLEDSLAELEAVAGLSGSGARTSNNQRGSRTPAKTRVKAKAKTKSKVKAKAASKTKAKTTRKAPSKAKPAAKTKAKLGARKSAVKPKLARN